jgi:hypothetical protein
MRRLRLFPAWQIGVLFILALVLIGLSQSYEAVAQGGPGKNGNNQGQPTAEGQVQSQQASAQPTFPTGVATDQPTVLTDEHKKRLEEALARKGGAPAIPPSPADSAAASAAPPPGSETGAAGPAAAPAQEPADDSPASALDSPADGLLSQIGASVAETPPLTHAVDSAFVVFDNRTNWPGAVSPTVPVGFQSTVQEVSIARNGKYVRATGNWYSAFSTNGGSAWTYRNIFADFPDVCCDQVVVYDNSHDRFLWYRQGLRDGAGNNRVGITIINGANNAELCTYFLSPIGTFGLPGQWFDYPHIQLGADNMYVTTNVFNSADRWTRNVIMRLPLNEMSRCAGFGFSFFSSNIDFTWTPVQGAKHIMYWASNWPNPFVANRLRIYRWAEDSGAISSFFYATPAFTPTGRGFANCGVAAGDWTDRLDQRVSTGARYSIMATNVKFPGRKVLGFWWNVAQGGGFARPYVEGFAVFEDTMALVPGAQGRPLIFNQTDCFAYPSITPNKRQDLAAVVHIGRQSTGFKPDVLACIKDDFALAAPGWDPCVTVATSLARPSNNAWGDYNTLREFEPSELFWVLGSHAIKRTTNCSTDGLLPVCAQGVYATFGRSREHNNWSRWRTK